MIIKKLKEWKQQIRAKRRLEGFKKKIVKLDKHKNKMRKNSSLVLSSLKSV